MLLLFTALAVLSFCGGTLAMPSDRAMAKEEPTDRLLGGDPLERFDKYPFYVTLHGTYFWWPFYRYRCPALLYDSSTLITTAQCVLGSMATFASSLYASCGGQWRKIEKKLMHPDVNFTTTEDEPFVPNDIGLMYVHTPFAITDHCQRVKLPDCSDARFPFREADVIGLNTNETEDTFNEPSVVRLTVLPKHYCTYFFGYAFDWDMHICMKDPLEEQAACFNDQGAPALLDDNTVVALGSWIEPRCRRGVFAYPSVFTRLANYLGWFKECGVETFD